MARVSRLLLRCCRREVIVVVLGVELHGRVGSHVDVLTASSGAVMYLVCKAEPVGERLGCSENGDAEEEACVDCGGGAGRTNLEKCCQGLDLKEGLVEIWSCG